MHDLRSLGGMLSRSDNFQLNAIYAVHAVNKEDQDEDEGDAQPVHHLGQDGVFGDEAVYDVVSSALEQVEMEVARWLLRT